MRVYNQKTNKVKEYAYKREDMARKRLLKECQDADNEIILCDNYTIHLIKQANESDFDWSISWICRTISWDGAILHI